MNDGVRSLLEAVRKAVSGIASVIATGVVVAGAIMQRFRDAVHAAESIARRYRWGISTAWSLQVIMALGDMADRNAPYHVFEGLMVDYYSNDNWLELDDLVEGTCQYESVSPLRRKVLRDTVLLIRAGERDGFNAASFAVPTLFAHLEGLLRDYGREDLGLVEGTTKKSITVKDITPALWSVAAPVERPSLDVMTNLLYKSYRSHNPPKGQRFSRHLFNHGRALEPGRVSYVIRLLLMIDQVAYLIDKARGLESEAVKLRRSWSEILSMRRVSETPWRDHALTENGVATANYIAARMLPASDSMTSSDMR